MATTEQKICLKIMVDIKAKKIVFAEADKEFVSFLFTLMSLPLATITKVLLQNEKGMVGSIGTLYKSIEALDAQCFCRKGSGGSFTATDVIELNVNLTVPLLSLGFSNAFGKVYVNGGTVYMVMDNLEVKPMYIVLLKSYVKEIDMLEAKEVQVGVQEAVAILKASLQTSDVLTAVFLQK